MSDAEGILSSLGITMFEVYGSNARKLNEAINRFNLLTDIIGPVGEETRSRAVSQLVDMKTFLGTDRIELSDHLAVVPNYNASRYGKYDTIVYKVGFELVVRDFRNWEAMFHNITEDTSVRNIMHPTGKVIPIAKPSLKVRVFDVPIGYLYGYVLDMNAGTVTLMANPQGDPKNTVIKLRVGILKSSIDRIAQDKVVSKFIDDMSRDTDESPSDDIEDESYLIE